MSDDEDYPDLATHPVPDGSTIVSTSLHMPYQDGSKWERIMFRDPTGQSHFRRRFVPAIVNVPVMKLGRQGS